MKSRLATVAVVIMAAAIVRAEDAPGGGQAPKGRHPGGPGNPGERFARMDANSNGVIDKVEFRGPTNMFARIDKDGSGTLSKEEMQAFMAASTPEERFKKMDTNGNGVIDKDEFRGPPAMFAKMDKDGSGTLSKEELKPAREQHPRPGGPEHVKKEGTPAPAAP